MKTMSAMLRGMALVAVLALVSTHADEKAPVPAAASSEAKTVTFSLSGADCPSCAKKITETYTKTAGVSDAQVDYKAGTLKVTFDPKQINEDKLLTVLGEGSSYKVAKLDAKK